MSNKSLHYRDRTPHQLARAGVSTHANNRVEPRVLFVGDGPFLGSIDSSGGRAPFIAGASELGYVFRPVGPFTTQPGTFSRLPGFENRHACVDGATLANARLGTGGFAGTGGIRQIVQSGTGREADFIFVLFGSEDLTGFPDTRSEIRTRYRLLLEEISIGISARLDVNKQQARVFAGVSGVWRTFGTPAAPYTDAGWENRRLGLLDAIADLRSSTTAAFSVEYWGYAEAVRSVVNLSVHGHYVGTLPGPWGETLYGASMLAALDIPGVGMREALEAIAAHPGWQPTHSTWDSAFSAATSLTVPGTGNLDCVVLDRVHAGITGTPANMPRVRSGATNLLTLSPTNPAVAPNHVHSNADLIVERRDGDMICAQWTRHQTYPPQFIQGKVSM